MNTSHFSFQTSRTFPTHMPCDAHGGNSDAAQTHLSSLTSVNCSGSPFEEDACDPIGVDLPRPTPVKPVPVCTHKPTEPCTSVRGDSFYIQSNHALAGPMLLPIPTESFFHPDPPPEDHTSIGKMPSKRNHRTVLENLSAVMSKTAQEYTTCVPPHASHVRKQNVEDIKNFHNAFSSGHKIIQAYTLRKYQCLLQDLALYLETKTHRSLRSFQDEYLRNHLLFFNSILDMYAEDIYLRLIDKMTFQSTEGQPKERSDEKNAQVKEEAQDDLTTILKAAIDALNNFYASLDPDKHCSFQNKYRDTTHHDTSLKSGSVSRSLFRLQPTYPYAREMASCVIRRQPATFSSISTGSMSTGPSPQSNPLILPEIHAWGCADILKFFQAILPEDFGNYMKSEAPASPIERCNASRLAVFLNFNSSYASLYSVEALIVHTAILKDIGFYLEKIQAPASNLLRFKRVYQSSCTSANTICTSANTITISTPLLKDRAFEEALNANPIFQGYRQNVLMRATHQALHRSIIGKALNTISVTLKTFYFSLDASNGKNKKRQGQARAKPRSRKKVGSDGSGASKT